MAKKIVWTKRANTNFNKIIVFLDKNWGESVIIGFVQKTYDIIALISENPELGNIENLQKGIRGFLITKHNHCFTGI